MFEIVSIEVFSMKVFFKKYYKWFFFCLLKFCRPPYFSLKIFLKILSNELLVNSTKKNTLFDGFSFIYTNGFWTVKVICKWNTVLKHFIYQIEIYGMFGNCYLEQFSVF